MISAFNQPGQFTRWSVRSAALGSALALMLCACGDESPEPGEAADAGASASGELPSPLAITADWVAGTLSFVDLSGLIGGASRADAVVSTLDLSEFQPGPMALELTPDGKKVLVAASAGFFSIGGAGALILGGADIPSARGRFVMVDIDTQEIEHDLDTGESPMGIAVTPDGKQAFVAHFGTGNMVVVDLSTFQITEDIEIGIYAEEVIFDDTGTVGIVCYSSAGSVRTFAVADPANTLSPEVKLEGDSAGMAFFPGTKIAYVVQAPNPVAVALGRPMSGHTLVDVSNPSSPAVIEDVRAPTVIGSYPAMAAPNRGSVIVPAAQDSVFSVREYALEDNKAVLKQEIPVGEAGYLGALGFGYDGVNTVVMAVPGDRTVVVTNLETQETRSIPWEQDVAGPADVVIR